MLNDRQKDLVHFFISSQDVTTTITSHKTINDVSRQTAAKDLKELNLDFSGDDKIKSPPAMILTDAGFRADVDIEIPDGSVKHLFILQDSKLVEE